MSKYNEKPESMDENEWGKGVAKRFSELGLNLNDAKIHCHVSYILDEWYLGDVPEELNYRQWVELVIEALGDAGSIRDAVIMVMNDWSD